MIAINLSANFHAIRAVIPQMRQRNWGRIINVASAHGLVASVITGETLYVDGGYHIID